jgi:hypothetical protein
MGRHKDGYCRPTAEPHKKDALGVQFPSGDEKI